MADNFHGFHDAIDDIFDSYQSSFDEVNKRGAYEFERIATNKAKTAAACLAGDSGANSDYGEYLGSDSAGLFKRKSYYGEYKPDKYKRTGQVGAAVVDGSRATVKELNPGYSVTIYIEDNYEIMNHSDMSVTRKWKRKKDGTSVSKEYRYPANEYKIMTNFWNGKHGYRYHRANRTAIASDYLKILGVNLQDDYEYIVNSLFD